MRLGGGNYIVSRSEREIERDGARRSELYHEYERES